MLDQILISHISPHCRQRLISGQTNHPPIDHPYHPCPAPGSRHRKTSHPDPCARPLLNPIHYHPDLQGYTKTKRIETTKMLLRAMWLLCRGRLPQPCSCRRTAALHRLWLRGLSLLCWRRTTTIRSTDKTNSRTIKSVVATAGTSPRPDCT